MLKKIIIAALIIWGLVIFYQKFMKSTFGSFFNKKGDVDFFQKSTSLDKVDK